jgi:hypothetical protein
MFKDGTDLGSLGRNSVSLAHDVVPFTFTSFSFSFPHWFGCWLACRLLRRLLRRLGCWRAFTLAALAAALAFALQHSFFVRRDILLQERSRHRVNLLGNSQNMETTTHQRDRGIRGSRARGGEFARSRL